ncbi:MAG: LLM class flavin-dependent oxidoreductase, partial [Actinobacteria bacterium]|nr:LLM class flavin-dependent oxidoreductase [Actinomycetota bacterium]
MEFGIYTFVENTPHPQMGGKLSNEQRMQNLLEEAELADELGLDVF